MNGRVRLNNLSLVLDAKATFPFSNLFEVNNTDNNNNNVLKTNKQTNKQLQQTTSRIYKGLYFNNNEEEINLLNQIEELRRRDGWNFSDFVKSALTEYVTRHFPGNPGLPLDHWTKNEPLSQAASEKLAPVKSSPNYSEMTDEELAKQYSSPRTDYSGRVIISAEIHKRKNVSRV